MCIIEYNEKYIKCKIYELILVYLYIKVGVFKLGVKLCFFKVFYLIVYVWRWVRWVFLKVIYKMDLMIFWEIICFKWKESWGELGWFKIIK